LTGAVGLRKKARPGVLNSYRQPHAESSAALVKTLELRCLARLLLEDCRQKRQHLVAAGALQVTAAGSAVSLRPAFVQPPMNCDPPRASFWRYPDLSATAPLGTIPSPESKRVANARRIMAFFAYITISLHFLLPVNYSTNEIRLYRSIIYRAKVVASRQLPLEMKQENLFLHQVGFGASKIKKKWWARRDSNPQPSGYEPPALTIELQAPRGLDSVFFTLAQGFLGKLNNHAAINS
jgi:hypothetical protein